LCIPRKLPFKAFKILIKVIDI